MVAELEHHAARPPLPQTTRQRGCFGKRDPPGRKTQEQRCLRLVRRKYVHLCQQLLTQWLCRRRIENRLRPLFASQRQGANHRIERRFQLEQNKSRAAEQRPHGIHVSRRQRVVGAGCHHDGILALLIHPDKRDARGLILSGQHCAGVDAPRHQAGFQVIREHVLSHASHHARVRARSSEFTHRYRLIRALASGNHLEAAAQNGLAGRR